MKEAVLALADGTVFKGKSFGSSGEVMGEVVFNTSLSGYQEILTDPSYCGQIVNMTYPLIGNYGINSEDVESVKISSSALIVKELSRVTSNWRSTKSLDKYLEENNIIGLADIDTRMLTRHIRDVGAQQGVISTMGTDVDELVAKARASKSIVGRDLVKDVTCGGRYHWREGEWALEAGYPIMIDEDYRSGKWFKVAVLDFGVKQNILRMLVGSRCDVTVFPASTSYEEIMEFNPDGVFLSNGPGDPEGVPYAIETVRRLIGKKPIFGICLGHQILALAMGKKTYKLKFGHRGANHPVKDLKTGKIEITSQNHGFAVKLEDLNPCDGGNKWVSNENSDLILTHINLNDFTVEGIRHKSLPIFSVQYHPEASPGPHDSSYLFGRFVEMLAESKAKG